MTDESQAQTSDQKVIGDDVAEVEFAKFVKALRAKVPEPNDKGEMPADFVRHKETFIEALQNGSLKVNERGCPAFTPRFSTLPSAPVVFKRPTGESLLAADGLDDDHGVAKTMRMMAQLTSQNLIDLQKLDLDDLGVLLAIQGLLLG